MTTRAPESVTISTPSTCAASHDVRKSARVRLGGSFSRSGAERVVEVPHVHVQDVVRRVSTVEKVVEKVVEVPKIKMQVVEKVVGVPHIQYVDQIVEMPQS